MSNNDMTFRRIELSYDKALCAAYHTYSRYRGFHEWAMAHCDDADADTRKNMVEQDAIMYAEVRGQLALIARLFAWDDIDEATIQMELKEMYEANEDALA